jgi:hypothetical protein
MAVLLWAGGRGWEGEGGAGGRERAAEGGVQGQSAAPILPSAAPVWFRV